jgi:hypothetical protein
MWKKLGCGCASLFAVVLVVVFVVLVTGIGDSPNAPKPDPTKSAQHTSGDAVGAGTYLVGKDIPAGTYTTPGPDASDMCYWQRSKDSSGEVESIIANDDVTGPGRVTIKAGETVDFSGGCEWHRA